LENPVVPWKVWGVEMGPVKVPLPEEVELALELTEAVEVELLEPLAVAVALAEPVELADAVELDETVELAELESLATRTFWAAGLVQETESEAITSGKLSACTGVMLMTPAAPASEERSSVELRVIEAPTKSSESYSA
jgi:hypothetical protein